MNVYGEGWQRWEAPLPTFPQLRSVSATLEVEKVWVRGDNDQTASCLTRSSQMATSKEEKPPFFIVSLGGVPGNAQVQNEVFKKSDVSLENERRVEGRPSPRNDHGRFGRKSRVANMYQYR